MQTSCVISPRSEEGDQVATTMMLFSPAGSLPTTIRSYSARVTSRVSWARIDCLFFGCHVPFDPLQVPDKSSKQRKKEGRLFKDGSRIKDCSAKCRGRIAKPRWAAV